MEQPENERPLSEDRRAALRWRLVLGKEAEQLNSAFGLGTSGGQGEGSQGGGGFDLGGMDMPDWENVEQSLDFIYNDNGPRSGSLDAPAVYLPKWLGDIRRYFPRDTVSLLQRDAMEQRGLRQLLFEPETLPQIERNVELVSTLIALKDMIPERSKETAREVVREIVNDLQEQLVNQVRQSVTGALQRNRHSPQPMARNLDWVRTIRKNLKNYDPVRKQVIPEHFYFWSNARRYRDWHILIVVDQSGSMATSVVYASIFAAIFASLSVLKTSLVLFDTEVVDMSEHLSDPVDLLFGAQLGGGTDIGKAMRYSSQLIEEPEKTIFILISDLADGGRWEITANTFAALVESRVKAMTLLALSDKGKPSYDSTHAADLTELGVPCFGCTPNRLTRIIARILRGESDMHMITESE